MDEVQARAVEEARLVLDARQELYGESDPTTFDAMCCTAVPCRDAGDLPRGGRRAHGIGGPPEQVHA